MATYSTIKGFTIQTLASDPYTSAAASGTWASGGAVNTGRMLAAGTGTQTAALRAGGNVGVTAQALVESYDGSTWTEVGDLTTARRTYWGGAGTQTASLAIGGYTTTGVAVTEAYNGTGWTEVADLNTARNYKWLWNSKLRLWLSLDHREQL